MNRQKDLYKLFQYPVIMWIMVWVVYFVIHMQFSFLLSLGKSTLITLSQLAVFYTALKILLPRYFEKKPGKFVYLSFLLVLSITAFNMLFEYLLSDYLNLMEDNRLPYISSGFIQFLLNSVALWVSIAFFIFKRERTIQKEVEYLRNEKAETELKFLKAQINPHFLFNALNNIYTIAYIGDKTTPDKIAMLSEMLRYLIYDCKSDFVPLDKEMEYLKSYIAFQQLKTEKEQRIGMSIQVENKKAKIAPMILIPFVENAFKHSGIIKDKQGFVELKLIQKDHDLTFMVRNSIPVNKPETKTTNVGIGIENLKNRLKLIYKSKYSLHIEEKGREYFVMLNLSL